MGVSENKQYSICIVSDQLASGGAERCAALLSVYFEKHNCKVSHVIVIDNVEYEFAGELLNMGKLKNSSFYLFDRIKRFLILRRYFKKNKFDYIIDFRVKLKQWQDYFIVKFIFNSPLIVTVHSYMTELYFPKNKFLANSIYNQAKLVTVSNLINKKIRNNFVYTDVTTIYNPVDFNFFKLKAEEKVELNYRYIIAIGRFTKTKQFDEVIKSYSNSNLRNDNVKLLILGEGEEMKFVENTISKLGLEKDVILLGFQSNPYKYLKNALFLVMASKFEGFPMVLIESLACETPVVSYNCMSGPSEIIVDGFNGILVRNQDIDKLVEAINKMYEDKYFYSFCKQNTRQSVEKFSIERVGKQWMDLMKIN